MFQRAKLSTDCGFWNFGVAKIKPFARSFVWLTRTDKDIETFAQLCKMCRFVKYVNKIITH